MEIMAARLYKTEKKEIFLDIFSVLDSARAVKSGASRTWFDRSSICEVVCTKSPALAEGRYGVIPLARS